MLSQWHRTFYYACRPAQQFTQEKKMETLRNEELFEIEGGFWEGLAAAAYAFVTALVLL